MEADFLPAMIPTKHRVYGYDLKPYSLIHSFFLEAIESPFYTGSRLPTISDTVIAAAICSEDWPNLQKLKIPKWKRWIYRDPVKEVAAMRRYHRAYSSYPTPITRGGGGMRLGTPHQLRMVLSLCSLNVCANWREAWMFPYVTAAWITAAARENNTGKPAIEDEQVRADRAELAELEKQPKPDWMIKYEEEHRTK